ncbi:MAG: hypothetical protein U0992_07170 [Planctomycetaceae bacterium]
MPSAATGSVYEITEVVSGNACSPADEVAYVCPGERHAVSRAVHFARLAAFYPACRECSHRLDAGHLPQPIVEHFDRSARRNVRSSLLGLEGISGVYLNEMTRPLAERYAEAFAKVLWSRQPLQSRTLRGDAAESRRRLPTVIVGQDHHGAAADLVIGVAAALRRMGCQVVDVGIVSTACFWFAVEHLEGAGGVYVTGAGCGPAGIGLNFIDAGGIPWSRGGSLDQLAAMQVDGAARTSRQGGKQRSFRIRLPYEAGLLKQFHGVRPLRIGLACLSPTVEPHLSELLAAAACRAEHTTPPMGNDSSRVTELALERLSALVRLERLPAGVLLGEDGQSCLLVDEHGVRIATPELAAALAEVVLSESNSRNVVLDAALPPGLAERLEQRGCNVAMSDGTREGMARSMHREGAAFGCDGSDRCWFGDCASRCDGLATLARILQWLSRDDVASGLRSTSLRR